MTDRRTRYLSVGHMNALFERNTCYRPQIGLIFEHSASNRAHPNTVTHISLNQGCMGSFAVTLGVYEPYLSSLYPGYLGHISTDIRPHHARACYAYILWLQMYVHVINTKTFTYRVATISRID